MTIDCLYASNLCTNIHPTHNCLSDQLHALGYLYLGSRQLIRMHFSLLSAKRLRNTPGRDCGWPRRPWPNAGRKKQKNGRKITFFSLKNQIYPKNIFIFLHISSIYAKILGGKLFSTREIPWSGSKAKNREKEEEERKKERLNDGDNNGQAMHGASKHAWRTQAAWANLYHWTILYSPC